MKKILLALLLILTTASGFAQKRQAKVFLKTLSNPATAGIVASEAFKAAGRLKGRRQPTPPNTGTLTPPPTLHKEPFKKSHKLDSLLKHIDRTRYKMVSNPIRDARDESEKRLRKGYLEFKEKFEKGECDTLPRSLLLWSSYADSKGDADFAWEAFDKAKSEYLTVPDVLMYCSFSQDIRDKCVDLLWFVIERDYIFREGGLEKSIPDSVRSMYRERLTGLAREYDGSMIPLIDIVYRPEDSDRMNLHRTATDSIINGASSFLPMIQDDIFSNLLLEFMSARMYDEALAYFAKEPLSSYVESDPYASLSLCDASVMLGDTSKFNHYLQCAINVDSDVAQEYYEGYYEMCCDCIVEDPTDEELMDWLLEENDRPVELALYLKDAILDRHFPDTGDAYDFEWCDMSQFTHDQLEILKSVIRMGSKAIKMDNGRSDDVMRDLLIYSIAFLTTMDPTEIENATRHMDMLSDIARKNHDASYDDLRVLLIIWRAYLAAHGMDKPKEAYRILNKAKMQVDSMTSNPDIRRRYWQYLRDVCEAIGKKREAEKCDSRLALLE